MTKCRICNHEAERVFSLGELYLSNFTKEGTTKDSPKGDLTLCFCENCGLLQLENTSPPSLMYGKYWYRSGTNDTMREALSDVVSSIKKLVPLEKDDVWLDIASNDGTLLSYVGKDAIRVGIDPADDTYKNVALNHADSIIQNYFTLDNYKGGKYGDRKAKVVTCIAMFYDLDNPHSFLDDVYEVMEDDGLFVLQLSYTPLMIQQLAFDNICHEHVCYYSLTSLDYLLGMHGLRIVDCEFNIVNGGSVRVYVMKKDAAPHFQNAPYRDVANYRIQSAINYEDIEGFTCAGTYSLEFYPTINQLRKDVVDFIQQEILKGKSVGAYGASTKGQTLLQWFGLNNTLIKAIADRSPYKWGLKTVGTDIPIISEEQIRKEHPDYLLILPWHFCSEFVKRESEYLKLGGKFIVPCPKFEIIGS
jgi:NDP-4-keto-2,6-dideoxyhexose 3-C-methyltransferase